MAQTDPESPKRLSVKKYPNRRYYDATRSRHVTFEELHSLVRDGYELQVTDSKTGEDITAKVLAQLIIELDPPKLEVFPVPLLHGLLRSNQQAVTDFARRYFGGMVANFLESQRDWEQHLQRMMGIKQTAPTMADWARIMWGSLGQTPGSNAGNGTGSAAAESGDSPAPPPADEPEAEDLREQLKALRSEIQSLRKQVAPADGKRKARRK